MVMVETDVVPAQKNSRIVRGGPGGRIRGPRLPEGGRVPLRPVNKTKNWYGFKNHKLRTTTVA
jgi:hypothetical protein